MSTQPVPNHVPLPDNFQWLSNEPGPAILYQSLSLYGTKEMQGPQDNPVILSWAKDLGLKDYIHDSIAWCGLDMAICVHRASYEVVKDPLWAANWLHFGVPMKEAELGDILIFKRPGGNHVGLYVGETALNYWVMGGNQGDAHSIVQVSKLRCIGIRRPNYTLGIEPIPNNVRRISVGGSGIISQNEA